MIPSAASLLLLVLVRAVTVTAQRGTTLDPDGNTIIINVSTDRNGDPVNTLILSTVAPAAGAVTTPVITTPTPAVANTRTTAAAGAALTTTVVAAADDDTPTRAAGPAVNGAPPCTTCPAPPTTYNSYQLDANGRVIGTVAAVFTATTPVTAIPPEPTAGTILGYSQFFYSVQGLADAAAATHSGGTGAAVRGRGMDGIGIRGGDRGIWIPVLGALIVGAVML